MLVLLSFIHGKGREQRRLAQQEDLAIHVINRDGLLIEIPRKHPPRSLGCATWCCRLPGSPHPYLGDGLEMNISQAMSHDSFVEENLFIEDYNCIVCGMQVLEARDCLFLHCPFAQLYWSYFVLLGHPLIMVFKLKLLIFKEILGVPFALEIIVLASWAIWITRNDSIFKGSVLDLLEELNGFFTELRGNPISFLSHGLTLSDSSLLGSLGVSFTCNYFPLCFVAFFF